MADAAATVQPVRYVYRRTVTPVGTDVIVVETWSDGTRTERYMDDNAKRAYWATDPPDGREAWLPQGRRDG